MKTLTEICNEDRVDEARAIEYSVALIDVHDSEGMPITVHMCVDKPDQKAFEVWLEKNQDYLFMHAEGGNVEY